MSTTQPDRAALRLRRWAPGDLDLLRRLLGDPAPMVHLGGPETGEQIARRHARDLGLDDPSKGRMFVIEMGRGRGRSVGPRARSGRSASGSTPRTTAPPSG